MAMKMAASQIMRVLLTFMCVFSSVKKISASRAAQASQCGYKAVWSHSYAGITRIRSEGLDGNTSHLSRLAPAPLGL